MARLASEITPAASPLSRAEFHADGAVHVLGILAALAGGLYLAITNWAGSPLALSGAALYSATLLTAMTCSGLYNMAPPSQAKELLRRLDHASIFLLIAGTYTPFLLLGAGEPLILAAFFAVWGAALAGIVLKLAAPRRFDKVSIGLYLALGWSGVVLARPLIDVLGADVMIMIGVGGLIYSVGVIFHLWDRLPFQRALWHLFVLAAACVHFAAVAMALPG